MSNLPRVVGLVMLVAMGLLAAIGPEAFNLDPAKQSLSDRQRPSGV